GMPGIYLTSSEAGLDSQEQLPGCGAIIGVVLVLATLIYLLVGSLADPINTALLQTAGRVLGGWLVIPWVRCRLAGQRADFLGYFKYIDSLSLWHGTGRGVNVAPFGKVEEIRVRHNHNNEGNYSGSLLEVETDEGPLKLSARSVDKAEELAAFLDAL